MPLPFLELARLYCVSPLLPSEYGIRIVSAGSVGKDEFDLPTPRSITSLSSAVLGPNADDNSSMFTSALRPWTPTSVLKVHGFDGDCDENIVEDQARPGETSTGEAYISDELTPISALQSNSPQRAYDSFMKEAVPLPDVPITTEQKGETMEDVLREIRHHRAEWINEDGRVAEPRVRRKFTEGSYPNFTVKDEDDLPSLLRYAWKGKVKKLRKYLKVGDTLTYERKHLRFSVPFSRSLLAVETFLSPFSCACCIVRPCK